LAGKISRSRQTRWSGNDNIHDVEARVDVSNQQTKISRKNLF